MSKSKQVLSLMEQELSPAIVSDLDGVLAPIEPRLDALKDQDWDTFHQVGLELDPLPWALEIIKRFSPDHRVIFISGRPIDYFEQTQDWIRKVTGLQDFDLYLNDTDLNDYEFKVKVYQEQIEPKYKVLFVLDDRPRVVKSLRDIGLTVLQPNFIKH